mgnify:CR=1 FL=1
MLGFITPETTHVPHCGLPVGRHYCRPYSPGFVADADTASQCAEIGIILLMFGVGPQEAHFEMNTYDIYKKQLTIQAPSSTR